MTTLTMRPYLGEADLQPIVDLTNTCEAVDQLDNGTSLDELRSELSAPTVDQARDIRLWEDADGQLVGYAQLWIPNQGAERTGQLWFCVHPEMRGVGIEQSMIDWGTGRMREVGQEHGVRVRINSGSRDHHTERLALLEQAGFVLTRYFFTMHRSLSEPIPEPQVPEGFTLRHLAGEHEAEEWTAAFNQSFIDHWNHHEMGVELRRHWMQEPSYDPTLDLIAVAPDSRFAAFAWCGINQDENRRTGRNEGWIYSLGTRRGFRKIGLGRAILLFGLQRLKAAGVAIAALGVDAENPTGALRLYESVGFYKAYTRVVYSKAIETTSFAR